MPDEDTKPRTGATAADGGEGEDEETNERALSWLRVLMGVLFGMLILADLHLYSLYEAESSRVEAMDRRMERLDQTLSDLLTINENAEKIEKIEQRVSGIEVRVGELADSLEAEGDKLGPPEKRR